MSDDWIRYAMNSWIVWTDKSSTQIFHSIRPFLDEKDQMLIVPIDLAGGGAFGLLDPWIWNWINAKIPHSPFSLGDAALGAPGIPKK
jgi:hypothetical protein